MKPFLGKVVVVGQHVREPFPAHHLHGDAVRQAVGLVRACFIEGQRLQEAQMGLRHDCGVGMLECRPHEADSPGPQQRICGAIEGQKFRQHFIGRIEMVGDQGRVERPHTRMPLIAGAEQRNPVEGIDKEAVHAGRFGVP